MKKGLHSKMLALSVILFIFLSLPAAAAKFDMNDAISKIASFLFGKTGAVVATAQEEFVIEGTHPIALRPDGTNNYKLEWTNKAGITYNDAILAYDGSDIRLGRWTGSALRKLVVNEQQKIADEDYFVVSKNRYSRILQFKEIAPGASTLDRKGYIKIRDIGSGDLFEVSYLYNRANLVLNGNTYKVIVDSDTIVSLISVDLNGNGLFQQTKDATLYTMEGDSIRLNNINPAYVDIIHSGSISFILMGGVNGVLNIVSVTPPCGDGKCELRFGENSSNCPVDCKTCIW